MMSRHSGALITSCLLALIVGFAAVSSQSLWIDEANSATKALAPSFSQFAQGMLAERGSDAQMPLYMAMLWVWEKIFGSTEFALRAMNILLFTLAIGVIFLCLRRSFTERVFFAIFAVCSAFIWAYLDEARPYMLQFLGGVSCMVPLANLAFSEAKQGASDVALFSLGVVILCGSSLLGVVFALWFGAAFLYLLMRRERWPAILQRRDLIIAATLGIPVLGALCFYYLWTLSVGARASGIGRTSLASAGFAAYELLGFAGLGPGRSGLREASIEALTSHFAMLLLYGTILVAFILTATVDFRRRQSCSGMQAAFWAAPVIAVATVFALGILTDFRVLGRHCMPALPFVFMAMAMGAATIWQRQHRYAVRALVVLLALAMLSSALAYRFSDRHAKDDYRAAAMEAQKAVTNHGVVWWAADQMGAKYYGLSPQLGPATRPTDLEAGCVFMANSRDGKYLAGLPSPELVIVSKRDIYDREGSLEEWVRAHNFRLIVRRTGFDFYAEAHGAD